MIQIELELDDAMCTVMDYFEIFLQRMLMCKRAAEVLGCRFKAAGQREQALLKRGGSGKRQDLKKEFLFCFFEDFRYTEYIKGRISPVPEKGERRMLCRTEKF